VFGKDVGDMDVIAESWELSAHPAGQSKIAFGECVGKTLTEYIDYIGKDRLGWKAQTYDKFPIMIKLIDAKQNLSIQVHPADDYAMTVEGEYGKNEMWHILDADDDACIYVGFNKDVTKEEIRQRIADNTLMQVLNKIPVKKNDTFFLKAGTVHAIGAGCLICEIQQSSNVTYRLYDYGRLDKDGKARELHIEKALDVLNLNAYMPKTYDKYDAIIRSEYVRMLIGQCKYFTVNKYFVDGECNLPVSESSFQAFVILKGEGEISDGGNTYKTIAGDTWFAANKVKIKLNGKCSFLTVNI
jgi:mannose-6-phosphate isomerase